MAGTSPAMTPILHTLFRGRWHVGDAVTSRRIPSPASPILSRARRKFSDQVDLLPVTPDAQRQPGSGRLPSDNFDQFVGISNRKAGGPRHMIPDFQARNFGHAVADHPVDAGRSVAVHQRDTEPWT